MREAPASKAIASIRRGVQTAGEWRRLPSHMRDLVNIWVAARQWRVRGTEHDVGTHDPVLVCAYVSLPSRLRFLIYRPERGSGLTHGPTRALPAARPGSDGNPSARQHERRRRQRMA